MIEDREIEKALDWLVANAVPASQARATRVYLDEYRKSLKASLMGQKSGEPLGSQERFAYSHPDYIKHLDALRTAIEQDEKFRWLLASAEAKIECWRSFQANQRAQGKI